MASDNTLMSSGSLRVFINVIQVLTTIKSPQAVFYAKSIFSGSWSKHLRLARNCGRTLVSLLSFLLLLILIYPNFWICTDNCDHHGCRKRENKCCHKYIRGKNFKNAQLIVLRFNPWSRTPNDKYKILLCFSLRCLFVCVRAGKK